jgi:hypothetical protein
MAYRKYSLSNYDVNVDDDAALTAGKRSFTYIRQGRSLEHQLNVGRALLVGRRAVQQELGYEANDTRGGPDSMALNRWLAENGFAGISEHLRIDSLWVLDNWPDCQAHLKQIEEHEPHRLQVLGVRGLRERVEAERQRGVRSARLTPGQRGPTPTQLMQARIEALENAARSAGLVLEEDMGTFVPGNVKAYRNWKKYVEQDRAAELAKPDDEPI